MSNNGERSPVYFIPRNYEDSFITASGISFRSICEGAVLALLTVPIFIFLPISLLYRAILIAAFGGGLFAFGIIGIKHCYLSEFILNFFKFKRENHLTLRNDEDIFDALKEQSLPAEEDNSTEVQASKDLDETEQGESGEKNAKKTPKKREKRAKAAKK